MQAGDHRSPLRALHKFISHLNHKIFYYFTAFYLLILEAFT
ncbi:MAG: hypothetical protein R3Y53_09810 [Bacillota bacterium]